MDYELAKELKDNNFKTPRGIWFAEKMEYLPAPTLPKLIEACGEDLSAMLFIDNKWVVGRQGMPFSYLSEQHTQAKGATLKEAVARLWLTLNKVDTNKNT
jgi:hypothetical protein